MVQPVALVVFDIAGTTVQDNGEIAASFQQSLMAFGYNVPVEKINPLMGYKKTEAIERLLSEFETKKDSISANYIGKIHRLFLETMIGYYSSAHQVRPLPFAEEVFAGLKERNISIGLDTGFYKEITAVIMDRLGWIKDNKVDYVVSSNEVTAGRPFPYMIRALMLKAGVKDSRNVIKVGDTEADIHEGKNAGCLYSIGITTGAFTAAQLAVHEPSYIIHDLRELITLIDHIQ